MGSEKYWAIFSGEKQSRKYQLVGSTLIAYRSFVEVKTVKITKNDEKLSFGRMNRALLHFDRLNMGSEKWQAVFSG